jgi:hypothetical protein
MEVEASARSEAVSLFGAQISKRDEGTPAKD